MRMSDPRLTRRDVLAGGGAAALLIAGGRPALALSTPATLIEARAGSAQLLAPGKPSTPVWGFEGISPGPVLRVKQGDSLDVHLINRLPQPTTIHWHGIRIDNRMDGVPHLTQHAVEPGASFDYRFTPPDPGTFWYHPHERSYEQVARGLFGALIVEEREPPFADQDLVLVINDWRLTGDGAFHEKSLGSAHDQSHAGRLGNVLTVNGKPSLEHPVVRFERLRLRLVNASSARVLRLALEGATARLIAIDGQPVGPTSSYSGDLVLGPGNRADLMLDVLGEPGSAIVLAEISKGRLELGRLTVGRQASARAEPVAAPIALRPNLLSEPSPANALDAALLMEGGAMSETDMAVTKRPGPYWTFNGVAGMGEQPLFAARRGQTVLVGMRNATAWPHSMHYHGHHFRVIARSGGGRIDPYWWDTILMAPREEMTIAFVADNPGKWMIHCHMLDHQAAGMDTWFEVGG